MPAKNTPTRSKPEPTSCVHDASAEAPYNSKRLILCCDGTWNDTNARVDPASNVSRLSNAFARKCCSGMSQIIYYHAGVGTEVFQMAKIVGGTLGQGIVQDIVECYRFICDNYTVGDEIVVIGFSRGAFTARSVADMVCALGFLNHAGIEQLPHIFNDYKQWPTWKSESQFDEKKHFLGFTLENMERVEKIRNAREREKKRKQLIDEGMDRRAAGQAAWKAFYRPVYGGDRDGMQRDLSEMKKEMFHAMVKANENDDPTDRIVKTDAEYRKRLVEYDMCLVDHNGDEVEGRIKAVGVWDTVGSLGIPKSPFSRKLTRQAEEARLASFQVHPNVEYALHAIALDEWRTAFRPTMWELRNNTKTKLRQVWFPGNHGNVGGGWKDQQIATISLAWMADRLTSIGVEFSKAEMKHIFYSLHPDAKARHWGMGLICSPKGITGLPDRFYTVLMWPIRILAGKNTGITRRTPGEYQCDGPDRGRDLENTSELVHPSVRIRYLYGGFDLDDKGAWDMHGYELVPRSVEKDASPESPPGSHASQADWSPRLNRGESTYHTLAGPITCYYGTPPPKSPRRRIVHGEQPGHLELEPLGEVRHRWSWVNRDSKKELREEHIGKWERMYIKINKTMLSWQEERESVDLPRLNEERMSKVLDNYGVYGLHDVASWDKIWKQ